MRDEPQTVPPAEAAMRAAWQEVCMVEYRITGDMQKATAFADRIEKVYRDNLPREDAAKVEQLRAEIASLQERSDRLSRLEAAGVDNWEGYSFAFEDDDGTD